MRAQRNMGSIEGKKIGRGAQNSNHLRMGDSIENLAPFAAIDDEPTSLHTAKMPRHVSLRAIDASNELRNPKLAFG